MSAPVRSSNCGARTALSDGDLLALILNTGTKGETVTDVAQRLLAEHGGLRGLFRTELAELARVRGVGDAKSVRLKAALELGRRLAALSPDVRPQIGSPEGIINLPGIEMAALEQEQTTHRTPGYETPHHGHPNRDCSRAGRIGVGCGTDPRRGVPGASPCVCW